MADTFHPELRAGRWLPRGVGSPSWLWLARHAPLPPVRLPSTLTLQKRSLGHANVLVLRPTPTDRIRPALLWIHGGGFILGHPQQDLALCARFAQQLDLVVVAVDYRLAPDHPYPTPLDDCLAAFELMQCDAAALGIDPQRIVVAGASAGGGLAAGLTLRIHDLKLPAPRLSLLVYPMLDDRTIAPHHERSYHRLWNRKSNEFGWRAYLGAAFGRAEVPEYAAPARRHELSGLPPTWLGVGTLDLFYEEDLAYVTRLRAANVPTTLEVVDGAFHGFDAVLSNKSVSQRFFAAQAHAIRSALAE